MPMFDPEFCKAFSSLYLILVAVRRVKCCVRVTDRRWPLFMGGYDHTFRIQSYAACIFGLDSSDYGAGRLDHFVALLSLRRLRY